MLQKSRRAQRGWAKVPSTGADISSLNLFIHHERGEMEEGKEGGREREKKEMGEG